MIFIISYDQEYKRTIPAVLIDARASIPVINDQIGSVIKTYTDAAVSFINASNIPYKIETNNGNLVGYFTLNIKGQVSITAQQLRPAFVQFKNEISKQILSFVQSNDYMNDYLPNS